jgi:multidrug efflux pump subunit AcrA (membrane-fusion protein)
MKVLKTLVAVLAAGLMLFTLVGCSSKTSGATATTQVSTVKRGNLSLDITAAGNLALSVTQDLPVDLFYPSGTKGTIASVLVQLGDSVKAGQVLVTVDADEWNDELSIVQQSLTTAQRNATSKNFSATDAERLLATNQRQVSSAQTAVAKAQHQVDVKNLALMQAQLNVQSANYTLYQINQVKAAKDTVDKATDSLNFINNVIEGKYSGAIQITDLSSWYSLQVLTAASKAAAQQDLNAILNSTGTSLNTDVAILIAQKQLAVQQAQSALIDAQAAVDDAYTAVITAQQSVDDANYAVIKQQQTMANARADLDIANSTLADAQKKLADARAMSPEIKAPFDGFVTKVNVAGGDQVPNGTIAVTVADPDKFEMNILVSEMDIMKVNIGGDATISLNSLSGVSLPAKVTQIAPTATISSGVVNYAVTVNITSVTPVASGFPSGATANTTNPSATGNATRPAGGITPRAGASGAPFSGSRSTGQLPSTVAQNFQLKQGLTGTVDLIVSQRINVLVVPNNAITKSGGQSTVQVVTGNNTTEKRTVQIGINDWQNTEITSGLSEGEKIVVSKSVAPAATTSSQQRPQSIPFLGR